MAPGAHPVGRTAPLRVRANRPPFSSAGMIPRPNQSRPAPPGRYATVGPNKEIHSMLFAPFSADNEKPVPERRRSSPTRSPAATAWASPGPAWKKPVDFLENRRAAQREAEKGPSIYSALQRAEKA